MTQIREKLHLTPFSEIEELDVTYLYPPYIQLGTGTILAGPPGVGKSMLTCGIAAAVSNGWAMPDQDGKVIKNQNEPANVILMNGEDDPSRVLKKRLRLCGADMSRIYFPWGIDIDEHEKRLFTLQDLPLLREAMIELMPKLVIIDPIQLFLGPKVDMNRSNEVRPLLTQVANLGSDFDASMLMVAHPPKGAQTRAIYKIAGTFDFGGTCRSVLIADHNPDNPATQSILAQSKNNGGPKGISQVYSFAEGKFEWCGISPLTAENLEGPARGPKGDKQNEALSFLFKVLREQDQTLETIKKMAASEGISMSTVYRAKAEAGVNSYTQFKAVWWTLNKYNSV